MPLRWTLEKHMARKGWANAYQLAKGADLPKPTASRLVSGEFVARVDVDTLDTLCRVFRVKPWALLEWTPD